MIRSLLAAFVIGLAAPAAFAQSYAAMTPPHGLGQSAQSFGGPSPRGGYDIAVMDQYGAGRNVGVINQDGHNKVAACVRSGQQLNVCISLQEGF